VQHGPDDRLLNGDVDSPRAFALRRRTLEYDHRRRLSPVSGFIGGRIDLIPHQLYIAHEVSSRYAPRVLLSDEVGLGKTIEACLILHRLLLRGRISRVLILVPDSLVHQWFVELLRRFNLWFSIFDEERCEAIEEGAPDGNPFFEDQLILCSTSFLATSPKRAQQAIGADWDMLVVDEAHHLEWSPDEASPAYMIVEMLSKVAEGLLLLTATPEQLGIESHFGRLRLLDPERYADLGQFISESQDQKAIADLVEKIADSKVLNKKEQAKLVDLVGKKGLDDLEQNRDAIIEDLLDRYGPGRVIFRNTRAAMQGFPKRIARLTPLSPKEKKDAKLDWLVEKMDKLAPAKVLLICKTKEQVLQLDEALRSCTALNPAVFHEDLSIVQRDRNAAWFAEAEGTRLLLCSEIGSEGRNFQFAHHLILYDVPAQPELLEQRIGRLDRIGQTADIQIHVPYLKGSEEEVLVRWYHEGLNAFEQNLVGGNAISKQFGEQLDALSTSIDQKQLSKLLKETASFQQALRTQLAAGRNRLLEMNSFRPKVSSALIEQIKDEDRSADLERYMTEVFEYFGVDMEDLAPRSYRLRPSRENRDAFPSIPPEGASITFDRKRALSREDMRFVSWDHPMATGAIDMVLSTGAGSASYGLLRQGQGSALLLEAVFVLETSGGKGLAVDRFLPATPLRVVVDHSGKALTEEYPVDEVDPHLIAGNIDDLLENEVLVETLLPHMLKAAAEEAETRAQLVMAQSLRAMSQSLDHEIDRLIALQQKNDAIRSEELDAARRAKEELSELIVGRRVRLDAVQVMRVG
jgi:ATP-dependent helicase HepA